MRHLKLRLDDISVESFPIDAIDGSVATVRARAADTETCEEECGTIFTWICRSCNETECQNMTCVTCVWLNTCIITVCPAPPTATC